MYLLMLLATFMSAIYGYNLSIRPDYDRDIPHKKAMAVLFKFVHQHEAAKKVALNAGDNAYHADGILWLLPGDLVYTDDLAAAEDKQALVFKQGSGEGSEHYVLVRKATNEAGDTEGENIMRMGRTLFPGSVMASQIVCPSKEIDEDDVEAHCQPTKDSDDNITKTCCGDSRTYFVSYRILDARWLNRLTNQVNTDFMWAITKRRYAENIGVVTWSNSKNSWIFTGRIKLYAVYRKDKEEYMRDKPANTIYPMSRTERTQWVLPNKVFTRDFFKYKNGSQIKDDMCDNGCLVKIEEI